MATFFYLPTGDHSLDLSISLSTSANASPFTGGGPTGGERKTFRVAGGQRGVLRTSLKNEGDKCWVTSTLFDVEGKPLDQFRVPFMKRTEKERLAAESAGSHFYMPGDDYYWDVPFYQVSNFLLRPMGETDQFQVVKDRLELGGKVEKEFVQIENVATYLERAQFEYAFEPEVVDGKLILTDVGKKFFQQENWMHSRMR